jgi:hypothetical protein
VCADWRFSEGNAILGMIVMAGRSYTPGATRVAQPDRAIRAPLATGCSLPNIACDN